MVHGLETIKKLNGKTVEATKSYSVSADGEYYSSQFESIGEACKEGVGLVAEGAVFFVGEVVPPASPASCFDASDFMYSVIDRDEDYGGDWAEGWDRSTKEQRSELTKRVQCVIQNWLDKHELNPTFFNIGDTWRFVVGDGKAVAQ